MKSAGAALVLLALLPAAGRAQVARFVSAGLDAGSVQVRTAPASGGGEALSGSVLGGGGALHLGAVSFEATYAQGNLTSDSGSATPRDLVDGVVMLAIRPVRWLTLKGGPHLRSYVNPASTRRIETWEGRLRLEGALVGDVVRGHVEGWRSFSASVNVGSPLDYLQGGSAGISVRLPRAPFWGRLSYLIDQAAAVDGGTETLDGVIVAIGFGGR